MWCGLPRLHLRLKFKYFFDIFICHILGFHWNFTESVILFQPFENMILLYHIPNVIISYFVIYMVYIVIFQGFFRLYRGVFLASHRTMNFEKNFTGQTAKRTIETGHPQQSQRVFLETGASRELKQPPTALPLHCAVDHRRDPWVLASWWDKRRQRDHSSGEAYEIN